jgi:TPR repeat protein
MCTRKLFATLVPLLAFSFQTCPNPLEPAPPAERPKAEIWEEYCKDYEEKKDLQRVSLIPKDSLEELSEDELLKKAVAGDAAAQCRLGRRLYLFGTRQEWRMWLEKSAAKNNLDAQYNLGVILNKKGETQGIEWLEKAAARGDVDAKYKLGRLYYCGDDISQDYQLALKCFRDLAERGDSHGQFHLGLMYYKGEGVPQDFVAAHSWINLAASRAADNEGARARSLRDLLAAEMTKDQIAEAQNLARQWKPR